MKEKNSMIVELTLEIQRNQHFTKKEWRAKRKEQKKRQSSPEYIDAYIYSMEHDLVYDGIVDWSGCNIDESWEKYKEKVGYYKRHPEREAESKAFTKNVIAWWKEHCERMGWDY